MSTGKHLRKIREKADENRNTLNKLKTQFNSRSTQRKTQTQKKNQQEK